MQQLNKLTTDYSPSEDRLCLMGQDNAGQVYRLWVTRRLADILFQTLLEWLIQQNTAFAKSDLVQSFEQEKAAQALASQDTVPVSRDSANCSWLVDNIDITRGEDAVLLVFKGLKTEEASVAFRPMELRQWLAINYRVYQAAEWPLTVWPSWIAEQGEPENLPDAVHLH